MEVGRWFVKCKLYLISLFSKNVNQRWVGGQKSLKFGQRSLRMTPKDTAISQQMALISRFPY